MKRGRVFHYVQISLGLCSILFYLSSCNLSSAETAINPVSSTPVIPVYKVMEDSVTIEQIYPASIEGISSVEIRARVDGYLSSIQVEEGAFVRKGQWLFSIDDRPYLGLLRTAEAEWEVSKAQVEKSKIEADRMASLLARKLVADVQVQTAKANLAIAMADEQRAAAQVKNARITLDYCRITAPSSGYLGRLPNKLGSLIAAGSVQPLTYLSDVRQVLVYFSMSEESFAEWMEELPGKSVESKLKTLPPVHLRLASGKFYELPGKIELIQGQLERSSGTVVIRARFNNPDNYLREGNTAELLITKQIQNAVTVPQTATLSIQDKQLVYVVNDSNKVSQRLIKSIAKTPTHFVIKEGLKVGETIVLSGLDRLQEGMQIQPLDSIADAIK